MWSASSSTVTSMSASVQARRSIRSIRRPGVATRTSASRTGRSACDRHAAVDGREVTPSGGRAGPARRRPAWPVRGSAPGPGRAGLSDAGPRWPASRVSSGRPKASVLPDPVWARPSMSRPASASGSARAWIANGSRMSLAARARTSRESRPSEAKVAAGGGGAAAAASRGRLEFGTRLDARLLRGPGAPFRPAPYWPAIR